MEHVVAILAMILALIVHVGLDHWLEGLSKWARASFDYTFYAWMVLATNLIVAILWFFLAWWMIFRVRQTRLVAAVYIVFGLFWVTYPTLWMIGPEWLHPVLFPTSLRTLHVIYLNAGPARLTSAFILIVGLYGLASPWLRRFESC